MPQDHSFDVVSEFDRQELVNAVDQARREITTRYDFKGIGEELARDLTKRIRGEHPKAQVRTQGDQLRVSSKDKDELQAVIQQLRDLDVDVPLQFTNYR